MKTDPADLKARVRADLNDTGSPAEIYVDSHHMVMAEDDVRALLEALDAAEARAEKAYHNGMAAMAATADRHKQAEELERGMRRAAEVERDRIRELLIAALVHAGGWLGLDHFALAHASEYSIDTHVDGGADEMLITVRHKTTPRPATTREEL